MITIYIADAPVAPHELTALLITHLTDAEIGKLDIIRNNTLLSGRLFAALVEHQRFSSTEEFLTWIRAGIDAALGPEASA